MHGLHALSVDRQVAPDADAAAVFGDEGNRFQVLDLLRQRRLAIKSNQCFTL